MYTMRNALLKYALPVIALVLLATAAKDLFDTVKFGREGLDLYGCARTRTKRAGIITPSPTSVTAARAFRHHRPRALVQQARVRTRS
jgi:hypothetical protein